MSPPLPPADLASRELEWLALPQGAIVERFFTTAFDPIYFDRARGGRLNAADGSYGVLYAAEQMRGAFAETFLRRPGQRVIGLDLVRKKARVRLSVARELKLLKLYGTGLARAGMTAEITHGGLPYDAAGMVDGRLQPPTAARRHCLYRAP